MKPQGNRGKQIEVIKKGRKALPPEISRWRRGEHKKRHQELHAMLDELWGDYLRHKIKIGDKKPKLGDEVTINELIKWSHQQTIKPQE